MALSLTSPDALLLRQAVGIIQIGANQEIFIPRNLIPPLEAISFFHDLEATRQLIENMRLRIDCFSSQGGTDETDHPLEQEGHPAWSTRARSPGFLTATGNQPTDLFGVLKILLGGRGSAYHRHEWFSIHQ